MRGQQEIIGYRLSSTLGFGLTNRHIQLPMEMYFEVAMCPEHLQFLDTLGTRTVWFGA